MSTKEALYGMLDENEVHKQALETLNRLDIPLTIRRYLSNKYVMIVKIMLIRHAIEVSIPDVTPEYVSLLARLALKAHVEQSYLLDLITRHAFWPEYFEGNQ